MDIEEWELVHDDGFLEIIDGGAGNKIYSRKHVTTKHVLHTHNYFNISTESSQSFHFDPPENNLRVVASNQLVQVPIQKLSEDKLPLKLDLVVAPRIAITTDRMVIKSPSNQDVIASSQVFFKKENEFVDMKMDSPRSTASPRGIVSPLDAAGTFQYEHDCNMDLDIIKQEKGEDMMSWEEEEKEETGGGVEGFKLWRWSLTGVGALCSFGVTAAATICIIIFTSHQKNKNKNNQKLQFQIYTDDKRVKQVVQHATKLNEAISVARGVPLTRAHFTVGGYYDGL